MAGNSRRVQKILVVCFLAGLPWIGVVVAGLFTERLLEFSVQWSVGDSVWSGLIVVGIGIATAMVMAGLFVVIPQLLAVSALVRVSSPPLVEGHGNPPPK